MQDPKKLTNLPQNPEGIAQNPANDSQTAPEIDLNEIMMGVEEREIQRLRDQIRVKYAEFIKSSCNNCYGSGTMGLRGNMKMGEVSYPVICICVQRKLSKSPEELLSDLIVGLQAEEGTTG